MLFCQQPRLKSENRHAMFVIKSLMIPSRFRWSIGYDACYCTQGSRVQTRQRAMEFKEDKNT
jgi:hypothetical protein